ncbi:Tim54p [Sugiyamaella lignohabitans]|uniref:Mitochondrial import inner membrane translocase subunit TIM54 n=1 Tax=Sugiyamaella lignohabitans TaxID=796027 RepID=A0A161HJB1_9ASCO|nr:Tim54p [Sugiyamaella lignohabitans]ANB11458.1 Tim54p [Sugiyamaella lignohabitans]
MDTGSKKTETGAGSTAGASKPPRSKGYTNPALQAMGIPRLRLPSRNWSIFWALTLTVTGVYAHDRYQRKQIRQKWKDRVSHLAAQPMNPLELPRKVTVYIAPPPADYLDLGFAHFRQYIKPILVAAAIDYEVRSESRQGEIRALVAEEIRNQRRSDAGLPTTGEQNDDLDDMIASKVYRDNTGGVICVGRGAYKEYMNGLHEGWLGPLEAPVEEVSEASTNDQLPLSDSAVNSAELSSGSDANANSTTEVTSAEAATPVEGLAVSSRAASETVSSPSKGEVQTLDQAKESLESVEEFPDRERDLQDIYGQLPEKKDGEEAAGSGDAEGSEKKEEKKKVPKPYIKIPEYEDLETPAQLETLAKFEPLAAIHFPHLLGFRNTPKRMYRFFNRRKLAEEMGEATAAVVFAQTRQFKPHEDQDLLKHEENEWPAQWKAKGLETGSEWMWDFAVDERIGNKLSVYEFRDNNTTSDEFSSD